MNFLKVVIVVIVLITGGWYLTTNIQKTDNTQSNTSDKLSITTSFYPLQFALEKIVGDLGVVTNIGEGKDPHDFEPTTQNILTLQKSDLVVLQGADFETWGDDVITQLEADKIPVVLATENIKLHERNSNHTGHEDEHEAEENHEGEEHENDHEDEHNHGKFDPHTWLDPILFSETVQTLTTKISEIDPQNATIYRKNADMLVAELKKLDEEYKNQLANCSINEVITTHNSFSYVAERYEFEVHSISGLSTQDTPSITVLAELKEEAKEGIGAILLEDNSIKAYGETLARETGLKTLSINPIAYMVPAGDNYLTLMQKNLNTFAEALKCNE
jgi:zinc transport system substrate-binding protein